MRFNVLSCDAWFLQGSGLLQQSAKSWLTSPYFIGYVVLYALSLFLLHRREQFGVAEPLLVLVVVGIGFSALACWFTRHVSSLPVEVKFPGRETLALLTYLVFVAGFLAWGLNRIHAAFPHEPGTSIAVLVAKLLVFVIIPGLLWWALWGVRVHDYFKLGGWRTHLWPGVWMSAVLIAFQVIFGQGLATIRQSGLNPWTVLLSLPFVYLWLLVEVGLVEEFFFRALLQSRLTAWLKSEVGAIVVMSLLFGLAHAPGLYFRAGRTLELVGTSPSWLMALGYSIVVTSVAGFFLGVLWARTQNLLLVMAVHAAGDLIPNLAPIVKAWL